KLTKRDVSLGLVHHVGRNAGPFAPLLRRRVFRIRVPALWQEQLAVDERVEVLPRVRDVNGDDAVVDLAALAAVLPFDAGSPFALLVVTRFIDDKHATRSTVACGDLLLQRLANARVVPLVPTEEELQRSGIRSLRVCDRFQRLPFDGTQLPSRKPPEVLAVLDLTQQLIVGP